MTDRDLIREAAETVMGWRIHVRNTAHWTDAGKFRDCDYVVRAHVYVPGVTNDGWNPLDSISDAFMLVDALTDIFLFDLTLRGYWEAVFHDTTKRHVGGSKERCRAITMAAIEAAKARKA